MKMYLYPEESKPVDGTDPRDKFYDDPCRFKFALYTREIAEELLRICTFKHPDGRPYKDDALDTWALLYAEEYPEISWEEVEAELERRQKHV